MRIDAKEFGTLLIVGLILFVGLAAMADPFEPITVTDHTVTAALADPDPSSYQPRYMSGFGSGDSFTVFFEDRDAVNTISYVSTISGPTGFPSSATATNITDTHFVVKDWPINVAGTNYAYRGWGAVGNNVDHHFYVSNDLKTWVLVSTFTIPNAPGFTDAHGWVFYGFHDVIELNGTYYAFAESNQSQTMLVRSTNGDDVWEAFASVGGRPGWGPLELPAGVSYGWTPSGSFVDLGRDRGYGKIHVDPRNSQFYLAVNAAAKASLPLAELEAAFIDPDNWTWHDGTTGPAANPILTETAEHDLRECWVALDSDPSAAWVIVYDADFGSADGGKALGYATLSPPLPPPEIVWVDDDYCDGCGNDGHAWGYDAFDNIQDGIDAVTGSTVNVAAGTYTEAILIDKPLTLRGATAGVNKNGYAVPANYAWDDTVESIINHPNPGGGYITIVDIYDVGDVTFEGFVVQELDAVANLNSSLVRVYAHTREIDNIVVRNNIIGPNTNTTYQDGKQGRMGLYIVNHPYDDNGVINSRFSGNKIFDCKGNGNNVFLWSSYYAYGAPGPASMAGTVIEDNEICGSHRSGIETAGGFSGLTIRDNTIYGNSGPGDTPDLKYGNGILMIRGSGDREICNGYGPVDVTIEGNDIFGNEDHGIYMGPNNEGITIVGNDIHDNGSDAVRVDLIGNYWNPDFDPEPGPYTCLAGSQNVTVSSNNIENNGAGVQVIGTPDNGFVLDATCNWWGDASGPYDPTGTTEVPPCTDDPTTESNADGLGDSVSDNVDYCPWLVSFWPYVEFSHFAIDHAKIDFKMKADDDKVRVRGSLESDVTGSGVDISEAVTVTVGSLSEIISMEEKGKKGDKWEYKRPKGGTGDIQKMTIDWKKGTFDIRMDKADLTGVTNPVTISIRIGDDVGTASILMREKKHHWDYTVAKPKAVELEPFAVTDELKVVAYPNPVRDVHTATFQVMGSLADAVEEIRVSIFDLSGHLVWEESVPGSELDWHTDSLSGDYLANGFYMYRVLAKVNGSWTVMETGKIAILR